MILQVSSELKFDLVRLYNVDFEVKSARLKPKKYKSDNESTLFEHILNQRDDLEREMKRQIAMKERQIQEDKQHRIWQEEQLEYRKKNGIQEGKFIGLRWNDLTVDQKKDRIASYILSQQQMHEESEGTITQELEQLHKSVIDLLEQKKLKATRIKWKKNCGMITKIDFDEINAKKNEQRDEQNKSNSSQFKSNCSTKINETYTT